MRGCLVYFLCLFWVGSLFSFSRREAYLDLQHFLDSLRQKTERLRVIYQEEPEFSKEEKIQQARREYAFSLLQWDKSQQLCAQYKELYRAEEPRFRLLEQDLDKTFSTLKTYAFQITKLHSLDLYARSNRLKPGKLLRFRKFKNINTGALKDGEDLIQILKKVYIQYNLRSRVSLRQALETIAPVVENYPDFLPAFFWQARLYFELDQIEEAQRIMHYLLDVDPNLTIAKSIDEQMLSEDDLIDYSFDNTKIQNLPHEISPLDISQKPNPQQTLPADAIRRVPYVVVVGNSSAERPQSGLNEAQMVFELPVEEGNTRLLALYGQESSAAAAIGPVRSLRDYFVELLYFLDPLLLHCGSSPSGAKLLQELEFHTFDEMTVYTGFFRDDSRQSPANLYTTLDKLTEPAYARRKIRGDATTWLRTTQIGYPYHENQVQNVHVPFYRNYQVTWQFSEEQGMYERYINGVLQKDARTQEPIRARNLIVQKVKESPPLDEQGRINLETIGEGEMMAFVKGKPFQGKWIKPDLFAPIRYLDESGGEIAFFSGSIWVHLVSQTQKIRVENRKE